MKNHNIVALCLGIFVAALLWQYYLWPKYQLKRENPDFMAMVEETGQKELEESIDYSEPGEVLFVGDQLKEENVWKDLKNAPKQEEEIIFHSQANKPKDLLDILNEDETKKRNPINLENDDFVMSPANLAEETQGKEQEAQEEGQEEQENESSRITMLKLPAEFVVVKDDKGYKEFLQKNKGPYPKLNFKKDMFVAVISSSQASDSFFEIVKTDITETDVKVFYKVNLIFSSKGEIFKNYSVIKNTNLPVNFIQVK